MKKKELSIKEEYLSKKGQLGKKKTRLDISVTDNVIFISKDFGYTSEGYASSESLLEVLKALIHPENYSCHIHDLKTSESSKKGQLL